MPNNVVQPVVSPVLIGRANQRSAMEHLIAEAHTGQGRIVVLAGEAGIGKSRLLAEAQAHFLAMPQATQHKQARALIGYAFEHDRTTPYAPLVDLLRSLFSKGQVEQVLSELGPAAHSLAPLLPELAAMLPADAQNAQPDPDQEKRRIFQSLSEILLDPDRPQFVAIEDLHWCDDNSFEFLTYLARRLPTYPLLLVLTYRSDEVNPALRHFLASLDRERTVAEFSLAGLAIEEVDALIRTIFPQTAPVRADFLDALYTLTEGNPFFLEEILKSLLASGDIFYAEGRWTRKPMLSLAIPRSVHDAVARRVAQISPAASRLLTIASVAGRRFDFSVLERITGQAENELIALLKELIAAQLVIEESDEQFAFRHALTQQAVYSGLLARERRALHRQVANAIDQTAQPSLEQRLAELAYHYYEAADWERALDYGIRAGEQAQKLYAPQAAREQFDRAMEATKQLGKQPQVALLRARGQANEAMGHFEAAHADYISALETARRTGDRFAEWQSLFDVGFLWTGRDFAQARGYLENALSLARIIGDPAMLAQSLNRVGNWYANNEQPHVGVSYHREALTLAEALNDQAGEASALDLLGMSNLIGGDHTASATYYDRAVALFRRLSDRQGLASALAARSLLGGSYMAPTLTGPIVSTEVCRRDVEEAVSLMKQAGSRTGEAFALMWMAVALGARGLYSRAWWAAHECIAISAEIEHALTLAAGHFALGAIYLDLLMPEEAKQHTQAALDVSLKSSSLFLIGSSSAFHARACLATRSYKEALAVLDHALPADAPTVTVPQRLIAGARVEVALARGAPDAAIKLIDRLQADQPAAQVAPALLYWRARATTAPGDRAAATTLLENARESARAMEMLPILWRVEIELGHLYQTQGRRLDAAATWDSARKIVHRLASLVPDEAARVAFVRGAEALLPMPPTPTARKTAKQAAGGLTEREREVAALVAQGQSNRQIATRMVLSQRTVQVHITNILSKLDFQSRAQIAAWAVEKGITQGGQIADMREI